MVDFVKRYPSLVRAASWAISTYRSAISTYRALRRILRLAAVKMRYYPLELIVYHIVPFTSIGVQAKQYPWAVMKGPRNLAEKWNMLGEHEVIDCITNLAPRGLCIDAGSWVGKYALLMAKTAKRVIALEPDKHNFKFLKENIHLNNARHVEAMQVALDTEDGEASLAVSYATAGHSLEGAKRGYYYKIKTVSLKSLLADANEDIDLIKMDIERTEFRILPNLEDYIFQHVKQWLIEVHSKNKDEEQTIIDIFKKHGFTKLTWLEPTAYTRPRHLYVTK